MLVNRYSIKKKLGKGSSGITYNAIDSKRERVVAAILILKGKKENVLYLTKRTKKRINS